MARLRFRFLESDDRLFNQAEAELQINRAVVADIARLKDSSARLANRPLKFGDMAVLVRSNAQASNLQNLLRMSGVKSVLKTEESVFKTHEACETLRLLEAVLEPGRDTLLENRARHQLCRPSCGRDRGLGFKRGTVARMAREIPRLPQHLGRLMLYCPVPICVCGSKGAPAPGTLPRGRTYSDQFSASRGITSSS